VSAPIIVVGASLAGLRSIQALRAQGYEGRIVVIGDEPHPPYDRTLLSKGWLAGTVAMEDALLADADGIAQLDAEWRLGVRAVSLRTAPARVVLADGIEIPAAGVVIATGARARTLPASFGDVHVLRTVEDAEALRPALGPGARVTVVGCGLVGAETAATAAGLGCEVTIVEASPDVFTGAFGPLLAERLRREHAEHGVRIRTGAAVARRDGDTVVLADGAEILTDVLVAGIGAQPNDGWLAGSGVRCDDGVCTDRWGRTSVSGVVAAGDVARFDTVRGSVRTEHWTNAKEMPAVAVRALLAAVDGADPGEPYEPVHYFWSDQYSRRIQVAGRPGTGQTRIVAEVGESVAAVEESEDGPVAALGWDSPKEFARLRRALKRRPSGA
jgi:3-phenylpropionate/trans-cinnamate dioxygenase ferredoxin reductase subunit